MNVSLTPHLEKLIKKKIESGRYQSASEVVRQALRLLDENDRVLEARLRELKREIAKGIRQADRGELITFDEKLVEQINREGRKKLGTRRKAKRA